MLLHEEFRSIEGKGSLFFTKVTMKAKDDKMMILERYFEGCARDLSGCPS